MDIPDSVSLNLSDVSDPLVSEDIDTNAFLHNDVATIAVIAENVGYG
jgi:hypothetical protein